MKMLKKLIAFSAVVMAGSALATQCPIAGGSVPEGYTGQVGTNFSSVFIKPLNGEYRVTCKYYGPMTGVIYSNSAPSVSGPWQGDGCGQATGGNISQCQFN